MIFPLVLIWDYGAEKSSGIGVDGHDVRLIPQPPNAPPHPTNATSRGRGCPAGRRDGAREVGGLGWGIGGLGYEKNIVYISIHTHMLVPGLR